MIGNWIYFRCFIYIYIYFPGRERKERTVAVPRVVPFVVASQPVPTFATRSLLPDVVRPRPVSSRFRTHVCPRCFLVSARLFFPRTRYSPLATAAEAAAHRDLAHPLLIYRFPFMRAVRRRAGGGRIRVCTRARTHARAPAWRTLIFREIISSRKATVPRPCPREQDNWTKRGNSDEILVTYIHRNNALLHLPTRRLRCRFVLERRKRKKEISFRVFLSSFGEE